MKGYKDGGWASHKYKEKYGVWPNAIKPQMLKDGISDETRRYITSTQIRYAKRSKVA